MSAKKLIDDETIENCDVLYRGVSSKFPEPPIVFYPSNNTYKISSCVFATSSIDRFISVTIGSELQKSDRTPADILGDYLALVSVKAGQVRTLSLGIFRDRPLSEPAHANIFDKIRRSPSKFKKEVQKKLAQIASVEIYKQ